MRRLSALVLTGACAWFCACGPKEQPPVEKSPFQDLATHLNREEPCARNIPGEWSASYPIPALQDGKLVYKVWFGGWEGNPADGVTQHDAEGDAVFTAGGKVLSCTRRRNEPARYPARSIGGLTQRQWDEKQRRLYDLTEKVAAEFAADKPDRAVIADYSSVFGSVMEPEFAASYRELAPKFWEWLEANGGKGPRPPAKK